MIQTAKFIFICLGTTGLIDADIGIGAGAVFGAFILGFAFLKDTGWFALFMAFLLLYVA